MTDPRALLALAAKIKAADGPSRELDAEIHFSINDHIVRWRKTKWYFAFVERGGGEYLTDDFPGYTASLDAALMLVPEGWKLIKLSQCSYTSGGVWQAQLWSRLPKADDTGICAAVTPALSLAAAALKAMVTGTTSEGDA